MRRHSPYNYAFNNPVYFIDPDGMSPIPGALKSGLLVQDTNFLGVSDISNGNMGSTAIGESIAPEQNNTAAYKDYFQQVSDYAANADESLGGGCPDGDCGGEIPSKQKEPSYFKKALAMSAVLLADDVTGVGVADDIAIPFILLGGLILDNIIGSGNESYPGPWTETQPDPGKFPYSPGFQGGDNKNFFPEGNGNPYTKWIIRIGGAAALGKRLYEGQRTQVKDNTNVKRLEYYIPSP